MWTRRVLELADDSAHHDDMDAHLYDDEPELVRSNVVSPTTGQICFDMWRQTAVLVVYIAVLASNILFIPFIWEHLFSVLLLNCSKHCFDLPKVQDWDAIVLYGFTLAAWPIGSALSGPLLLYLARRRSLKFVCLGALAFMAAGAIVYGASPSVVATILGRFICGLGGGMIHMHIELNGVRPQTQV